MCGPWKRPGICAAESDSLCWVAECFHSHFCWQSYLSFLSRKMLGPPTYSQKNDFSFILWCCLFSQWFSKCRVKTLDVPIWRPTSRSTQTSPTFTRCLKSKRRTSLKATTWLRRSPTKLLACCRCFAIWQVWIINRACRCSAWSLQAHGLDSKTGSLLMCWPATTQLELWAAALGASLSKASQHTSPWRMCKSWVTLSILCWQRSKCWQTDACQSALWGHWRKVGSLSWRQELPLVWRCKLTKDFHT